MPAALRYSYGRAAAELGATPLRQSSPTAPGRTPLLGAPRGGGKAHRTEPDSIGGRSTVGSQSALCVVEQRKTLRGKGRGLSEDRRSEFRSPPLRLSSAEHPAQPGDAVGARFLWLLSFCKKKESTPARQARNPAVTHRPRTSSFQLPAAFQVVLLLQPILQLRPRDPKQTCGAGEVAV